MTTRIATSQVRHAQQIEAAVSGPDGVNTLIINTGALDINTLLNNPGDQMTTVKDSVRRAAASKSPERAVPASHSHRPRYELGIKEV